MSVPEELAQLARERSQVRCEYCRMHQSLQGATFHIEHIHPLSKGGTSSEGNLAVACPSCNLHKSDRIESVDPETKTPVALFHPRRQIWKQHFEWAGFQILGRSATGRATVVALHLNDPRRLQVREAEDLLGLFPVTRE